MKKTPQRTELTVTRRGLAAFFLLEHIQKFIDFSSGNLANKRKTNERLVKAGEAVLRAQPAPHCEVIKKFLQIDLVVECRL